MKRLMVLLVPLVLFGCSDDETSNAASDAPASSASPGYDAPTSPPAEPETAAPSAAPEIARETTPPGPATPSDGSAAQPDAQADSAGTRESTTMGDAASRSQAGARGDAAPGTMAQPGTGSETGTQTGAQAGTQGGPPMREYTIVQGDTLASIAKAHQLDADDLAEWNGIENPRRLQIGQKIRLSPPDARR